MIKTPLNKKGFTLIEIVIVMAILGLLLGGLLSTFIFSLNFFSEEDSQIVRQENLRFVSVEFEKDIRKSDQIVTVSGSCVAIGSIDYCLSANQVTREEVVIAKNIDVFTVLLDVDGAYINLSLSSTNDDRGNDVSITTRIYLRKGD